MDRTRLRRVALSGVLTVITLAAFPPSLTVGQEREILVTIAELNGSGVSGDATLTDNGDGTTTVDVLVDGAGGDHPIYLHSGTCSDLGDVEVGLNNVDAEGSSVTDVDLPLATIQDPEIGPHVINIHPSAEEIDTYIACGDIPLTEQSASAPADTQAADTPAAPVIAESCAEFDAWVWAQTVYLTDTDSNGPTLDPDGNGIACEDLPIHGFAPALWADTVPGTAVPAQVVRVVDGDTLEVLIDGQPDTVRLYQVDAPEAETCGAGSAMEFASLVLGLAPDGTVYLEGNENERDLFDRRLAHVWYELAGDVYLVNEVMLRGGWAEWDGAGDASGYTDQLRDAEQFSIDHVLGVRFECGEFHQAPGSVPTEEQLERARLHQPNQGQFGVPIERSESLPEAEPQEQPPAEPEAQQPIQTGDCDPSYPDFCIPPPSSVGDLDCGDVGGTWFTVYAPDPHGFDADANGYGCQS